MEAKKARLIGLKQTLKTTVFIFFLAEIFLFFQETNGDLANGILFFINAQLSPTILGLLLTLFIPAFLFGHRAGFEIIVLGRNPQWVGIKFVLISLCLIIAFLFIVVRPYHLPDNWLKQIFLPATLTMTIAMMIIWLWSTWRIKVRHATLRIVSILLLSMASIHVFGQTDDNPDSLSAWTDTSYLPVRLKAGRVNEKIILIEMGEKAAIYLPATTITDAAKEIKTNDYQRLAWLLDSTAQRSDTITINTTERHALISLYNLVSQQLKKGNATVFYKRQHSFVDSIFHRQERYGEHAVRFFYLPDKRPFFAQLEFLGILDQYSREHNHLEEYRKEGEKLASLRIE